MQSYQCQGCGGATGAPQRERGPNRVTNHVWRMRYQRPAPIAYKLGPKLTGQVVSCGSCKVISRYPRAIRALRRSLCLFAAGLVVSLAAGAESADAQAYRSYKSYRTQRAGMRPTKPVEKRQKEKSAHLQPVHLIVVSIP